MVLDHVRCVDDIAERKQARDDGPEQPRRAGSGIRLHGGRARGYGGFVSRASGGVGRRAPWSRWAAPEHTAERHARHGGLRARIWKCYPRPQGIVR